MMCLNGDILCLVNAITLTYAHEEQNHMYINNRVQLNNYSLYNQM